MGKGAGNTSHLPCVQLVYRRQREIQENSERQVEWQPNGASLQTALVRWQHSFELPEHKPISTFIRLILSFDLFSFAALGPIDSKAAQWCAIPYHTGRSYRSEPGNAETGILGRRGNAHYLGNQIGSSAFNDLHTSFASQINEPADCRSYQTGRTSTILWPISQVAHYDL